MIETQGENWKEEVLGWLKWLCCRATLFGRETKVYSRACFPSCLCSASFSVLTIKCFKTILLGEGQGKGRKSSVRGCTDPSRGDGGPEGAVSVQILEHFILWLALQKVHWTENPDDFPGKLSGLRNFPWNLSKLHSKSLSKPNQMPLSVLEPQGNS